MTLIDILEGWLKRGHNQWNVVAFKTISSRHTGANLKIFGSLKSLQSERFFIINKIPGTH